MTPSGRDSVRGAGEDKANMRRRYNTLPSSIILGNVSHPADSVEQTSNPESLHITAMRKLSHTPSESVREYGNRRGPWRVTLADVRVLHCRIGRTMARADVARPASASTEFPEPPVGLKRLGPPENPLGGI